MIKNLKHLASGKSKKSHKIDKLKSKDGSLSLRRSCLSSGISSPGFSHSSSFVREFDHRQLGGPSELQNSTTTCDITISEFNHKQTRPTGLNHSTSTNASEISAREILQGSSTASVLKPDHHKAPKPTGLNKLGPPSGINNSTSTSEITTKPPNLELKPELEEILSQSNYEKENQVLMIDTSDAEEREPITRSSRPSVSSSTVSAAAFYGSFSLKNDFSNLELCDSVDRLNHYLKETKADAKAGFPGRFLHAVIGQEALDVGSVVSTIAYAFLLSETKKSSEICTLPVINSKRAVFNLHSEVKWLLKTCRIDESSLVFTDEIDLSYHNRFGNLKLIIVNAQKIPSKQEGVKDKPHKVLKLFKEVDIQCDSLEDFSSVQDGSFCTFIAEKYAETSPEILAGNGISRLLLSGILLDTKNLTCSECTSKDKYMATLLINGAGRFGCSGLYQLLKYKMSDISELHVRDIIRKDFKKWSKSSSSARPNNISYIGMSSIGISVEELLKHEDSAANEVILFQESEKLRLLMIVSGYSDNQKSFKREILVSTHKPELMRTFVHFLSTSGTNLSLKSMNQFDLRNDLRAFEINTMLTSRRSIEKLLEEFDVTLRKH